MEEYKNLLNVNSGGYKLVFVKINLSVPEQGFYFGSQNFRHTILLTLYDKKFYLLDGNAGLPYYYQRGFLDILGKLNIQFCINKFWWQKDGCCDTGASVNSFYLSSYLTKKGMLDFTEDRNIDFDSIRNFIFEKYPCFPCEDPEFAGCLTDSFFVFAPPKCHLP